MKISKILSRRSVAAFTFVAIFMVFFAAISQSFRSSAQKQDLSSDFAPAAGAISGRVFQDFNGDGAYDTSGGTAAAPLAIDTGVANVTVSAYDSAGLLRGTATSAADGTYSVSTTGSTGPYRVEFTTIPAGFSPSARSTDSVNGGIAADSGSTVQFVPDLGTANVNLALNRPKDFCQNNPLICSQLYGIGPGDASPDAVFTVPYTAGSTRTLGAVNQQPTDFQVPGNTSLATSAQVGTTFGIAYQTQARKIFVSAFMKKHAAFGPGGTGAIYKIDRGTGAVSEYVNLNTVFGATTAGVNNHNAADYNIDNGQATWEAVGKTAFGGMAISEDEANLFVMNLANRRLYKIPTSGALDNATITSAAFPATMPGCTNAVDVRPFSVNFYEGLIYVGAICSAETSGLSTGLQAYVYTVNPMTLAFSAAPILQFPLNYTRGFMDNPADADWLGWRTTFATIANGQSEFMYPQPMLTDIEFDRGNMILALRDRGGDQVGYLNASNPNNAAQLWVGVSGGDILRACGSSPVWTLESNSRCGGGGTGPQGNGQGPGNGEFYYQDDYIPGGWHEEVGLGAAMQIPGRNEMVATMFDPAWMANPGDFKVLFAGGFRWMLNTGPAAGSQNRGYLAYWISEFGKAAGMGNVQAFCDAAPIEIGNRVWRDTNNNGVQDPGELGIAGVTVRLYKAGVLVGTAVTDANGEYYFVSSTVADPNTTDNIGQVNGGILPGMAYEVRFDNPVNFAVGGPLFGLVATTVNQTSQLGDDDSSDSDAVNVTNPTGSPAGTFPVISLTTGGPGTNNHTFDVGFRTIPTAANVSLQGRVMLQAGNGIRNVSVTLTEQDGTRHYATTGSFGYFRFDDLRAGQTVVVSVAAKRYTFSQPDRVVSLQDNLTDFNFIADQ